MPERADLAASAPSAEIVSKIPKRALGGGTCSISIVLHHEPCRAVVEVDDAGNRILGRRAVYDRRPRRGVEHVQIVGGLLLARGQSAVPVVAAAVASNGDIERIGALEPANAQGVSRNPAREHR